MDNTSTPTYGCSFGGTSCVSATSNTITFTGDSLGFTQIAVRELFTLTRTTGFNATVTLSDIQNRFFETAVTPEPSTFFLLGTALVGLAGFRGYPKLARRR